MKRLLCIFLTVLLFSGLVTVIPAAAEDGTEITVLFTHDTHDYLYPTETMEPDGLIAHGGAAKLKTLLENNKGENTVYLDAGDFAMGTLYQAAYATDAFELRNLGIVGCSVTTFGNHEFDYGAEGVAKMLRAAIASGDPLPEIVQSNIDLSGSLTPEQAEMKAAFEEYGVKEYTVLEIAGKRIGIFGLVGLDCIECIQTDLDYINYIDAARATVRKLREDEHCDAVIALSHSGTNGDGETGEDVDLANAVEGIDLIISGHTHSAYFTPVRVNNTVIVSAKEYLKFLGKITFTVTGSGIEIRDYRLIPVDASVAEDPDTAARIKVYEKQIEETYLASEGVGFDDVLCHSAFDFTPLDEMYATHNEYNMADLIADAYLYEARRNGIDDIDVALVGLGTIRGSICAGNVTVADAFEICSLGVGSDMSAGHPIVSAYLTGSELKLLTELDASLGTLVSSIKMNYCGLSYTFNEKRLILDRVTDVHLVRADGTTEKIEDDKLYRVAANMYAVNMLGMLNGLTKGLLSITPKDADGNPVTDYYAYALKDENGNEIKEWVALKNLLAGFPVGENGVPEIPDVYRGLQGRKVKISDTGLAVITNPGTATPIMMVVIISAGVIIVSVLFLVAWLCTKKKRMQ